ncbi:hypothetical protein FH608_017515 [Nonomuraea phyllanthi]|uniref:Uncharacterized protein n=1 Tax=Nonomuraea phyllanthi TaxID=2219224 RepID=A0A5C4WHC0_9ACTN|nr:hypothetical protein [Nonomuraea phyllanthi]KAB8193997.1 hypothetical protein FH608_017515 [Nonomuraea phyllanthi]QFY07598.1 hypothetical protein GBF35_13700 [Nonomuraea phyllanthi]
MADEKSRNRRRISIDGAGIERRRTAVQTIVDQVPPPRTDRGAVPGPVPGVSRDERDQVREG